MDNDESGCTRFDHLRTRQKQLPAHHRDKDQAGRAGETTIPPSDPAPALHLPQRLVQQRCAKLLWSCVAQHVVQQLL